MKVEAELESSKSNGSNTENEGLINKKDCFTSVRINISKKEVAPHRKSLFVDEKQGKD